jgi:hypothetical protein
VRSVEEDYRVHWVMDNLPSATKYVDETNPAKPVTIYDLGFPLGFRGSADIPGTKDGVAYLNNHLLLTIKYHKDESFDVRAHRPSRAPPPGTPLPGAHQRRRCSLRELVMEAPIAVSVACSPPCGRRRVGRAVRSLCRGRARALVTPAMAHVHWRSRRPPPRRLSRL